MEGSSNAEAGSDLSLIGLVAHADIVVQGVVLGLVLCSVACWAIIFEKTVRLAHLRRAVGRIEMVARDPERAPADRGLASQVMAAARAEFLDARAQAEGAGGLRGRLEEAMRLVYVTDLRRLEVGLPFLATIGSAAPFVGLFGTVWGIMRSFTAIAAAKDTSLAVVAPGIAEALIATAIGLAAAIPAVIAYNQILTALSRCSQRLGAAVTAIAKNAVRAAAGNLQASS